MVEWTTLVLVASLPVSRLVSHECLYLCDRAAIDALHFGGHDAARGWDGLGWRGRVGLIGWQGQM